MIFATYNFMQYFCLRNFTRHSNFFINLYSFQKVKGWADFILSHWYDNITSTEYILWYCSIPVQVWYDTAIQWVYIYIHAVLVYCDITVYTSTDILWFHWIFPVLVYCHITVYVSITRCIMWYYCTSVGIQICNEIRISVLDIPRYHMLQALYLHKYTFYVVILQYTTVLDIPMAFQYVSERDVLWLIYMALVL